MVEILPITRVQSPSSGSKGSDVVVETGSSHGSPRFRDAVVYPARSELEVRGVHREADSRFRLTVRGAPRSAMRPGSLLLSAGTEFFVTSWALLEGECRSGSYTVSRVPSDTGGEVGVRETRCELKPFEGSCEEASEGVFELRAEVPLPLIPGRRYTLRAEGVESGALVMLAGPKPSRAASRRICELLSKLDPTDSRAVERALLEVYGITPRMDENAVPRSDAAGDELQGSRAVGEGLRGFTDWVVSERYVEEIEELVREALSAAGSVSVKDLRTLVTEADSFVPLTLWRELIGDIQRRCGFSRRDGVLSDAGRPKVDPDTDEGDLSPGEKAVWSTILNAGAAGEHIKSSGIAASKPVVTRLVDRGLVVRLPNGRLFARSVYQELAAVEGEVDDRRAARLWGVSRNTGAELIERMVRDGLMRKTSPRSAVSRMSGESRAGARDRGPTDEHS